MNTKKVKRLRKEIGYHPSQPRKYSTENKTSVTIDPTDKRALYQEMKKELR